MTRILIIHDSPVVRVGIKTILSGLDRDIEMVGDEDSRQESLDRIHTECWDMVILDIRTQNKQDIENIKDILSWNSNLPILVFSSQPESILALRVFKAGAKGYLHHSATVEQIREAVETILSGGVYLSSKALAGFVSGLMVPGVPPPTSHFLTVSLKSCVC